MGATDTDWTDEDTRELLARADEVEQTTRPARHPCQVTFDRLAEHSEKYADQLTPRERAAIEVVMRALMAVGNGSR